MDFITLAGTRYSVRKYQDRKVPPETVEKISEAGRIAPTAVNYQPQRILVIQRKEDLEQLDQCTRFRYGAPMAFLICYDRSVCWNNPHTGEDSGKIDVSIILTHMMLEAAELGVGTVCVADFDPEGIRDRFHLPEDIIPVLLMPAGYPAEDARPHTWHEEKKPLAETVFWDHF